MQTSLNILEKRPEISRRNPVAAEDRNAAGEVFHTLLYNPAMHCWERTVQGKFSALELARAIENSLAVMATQPARKGLIDLRALQGNWSEMVKYILARFQDQTDIHGPLTLAFVLPESFAAQRTVWLLREQLRQLKRRDGSAGVAMLEFFQRRASAEAWLSMQV